MKWSIELSSEVFSQRFWKYDKDSIYSRNRDYNETTFSGPNLKFEDVNMTDLNLTGTTIPDSLAVGQNLRIIAVVEEFDEDMGFLLLNPTITEIR